MKNFEKYKKEVYDAIALSNSDKLLVYAGIKFNPFIDDYREYKGRLCDWLFEEYKAPILDEVEREYLSAVIRPFRNRVENISKCDGGAWVTDEQFICIQVKREKNSDFISLPWFKENTMYKGMELNKSYTLQELGL